MNTAILRLAEREMSCGSERFFKSRKDDTYLYAYVCMRWCECGKTQMGLEGVYWDITRPSCADSPFSGSWEILNKDRLSRNDVIAWFKEHIWEVVKC